MNCGQVVSRICFITFALELCYLFNREICVSVLILVMLVDWDGVGVAGRYEGAMMLLHKAAV